MTSCLRAAAFLACAALFLISTAHAQQLPGESSADVLGLSALPAGPDLPAALVPLTVFADGVDGIRGPIGVRQLADASILVVNYTGNTIRRLSADGATNSPFASGGSGLVNPFNLEQLADGSVLVASYGSDAVLRFPATGGTPSTFANSADGLDDPADIVRRSDGSVLVANRSANTVLRFSADGSTVSTFANSADGLDGPVGLEILSDGTILVANVDTDTVLRFSADGSTVSTFANSADGLDSPIGIHELFDGTILVASVANDRVLQFSADGSTVSTFANSADGLTSPYYVDQLTNGTVLITDYGSSRVYSAPGPLGPPPAGQTLLYEALPPALPADASFAAALDDVGDVSGDGIPDLLVGQTGTASPGRAYLYDGVTGARLRTLAPPAGQDSPLFGAAVATAGDVDGDGLREVLVGAPVPAAGAPPSSTGRAYLFNGATGALLRTFVAPVGTAGGSRFAAAVASIVDLTGDGRRELIIGAPYADGTEPRAYVYNSVTGALVHTLYSANTEADGGFGAAVAALGDINGDGKQDIAVGAAGEGFGALPNGAGRVHVFSGATGARLYTLQSPAPEKFGAFGRDVVYAGVVDGTGTRALLVGADGEEPLQAADRAEGRAYLFNAATGALLRTLYVPDPTGRARFGAAVESGDDVDGDGFDDLFVGAPESTPSGGPSYAGRVFAFSGATGELVFELASPSGATEGHFGGALAPLLDVNGDGLTDLAVAAPDEPVGAGGARGHVYVFGEPLVPEVTVETLRPTTPIAIPASGGSLEVKNRLRNVGTSTVTVETWGVLTRPNGSSVLTAGVKDVTLLPGDPTGRRKTIELAAGAAPGTYVFTRYLGTYPNEVLASASYTFTKASAASPGSPSLALAAVPSPDGLDGLAWVDDGTFVVDGDETLAPEASSSSVAPLETALRSVSPNPSSGTATVRYDLAEAAAVRVTVYDALGRAVAVVADEAREAGRYEASVDASRLAPGVYVVRLTAGPFAATQRITVVR